MDPDQAKQELSEGDIIEVVESREGNWMEGARLEVDNVQLYSDKSADVVRGASGGDITYIGFSVLNQDEATSSFKTPRGSLKPSEGEWWIIPSAVRVFADRVRIRRIG